jgi:hypothetical protein
MRCPTTAEAPRTAWPPTGDGDRRWSLVEPPNRRFGGHVRLLERSDELGGMVSVRRGQGTLGLLVEWLAADAVGSVSTCRPAWTRCWMARAALVLGR